MIVDETIISSDDLVSNLLIMYKTSKDGLNLSNDVTGVSIFAQECYGVELLVASNKVGCIAATITKDISKEHFLFLKMELPKKDFDLILTKEKFSELIKELYGIENGYS
jgi:hypothetical protein